MPRRNGPARSLPRAQLGLRRRRCSVTFDKTQQDERFEATGTTRAEQETIIRWDQEDPTALLYTAHHVQARRWAKLGYPVEVSDRDRTGNPRGWEAQVPKETVRFRRLEDGAVVKRRTGAGRPFHAIDGASERQTESEVTSASSGGGDDA